jgi:hypothetical protein
LQHDASALFAYLDPLKAVSRTSRSSATVVAPPAVVAQPGGEEGDGSDVEMPDAASLAAVSRTPGTKGWGRTPLAKSPHSKVAATENLSEVPVLADRKDFLKVRLSRIAKSIITTD